MFVSKPAASAVTGLLRKIMSTRKKGFINCVYGFSVNKEGEREGGGSLALPSFTVSGRELQEASGLRDVHMLLSCACLRLRENLMALSATIYYAVSTQGFM